MTPMNNLGMSSNSAGSAGAYNTLSSAASSSLPQNSSQAPNSISPSEQVLQKAIPMIENVKAFFAEFGGIADSEMMEAIQALGRGIEKVVGRMGQGNSQQMQSGMGGGESGY